MWVEWMGETHLRWPLTPEWLNLYLAAYVWHSSSASQNNQHRIEKNNVFTINYNYKYPPRKPLFKGGNAFLYSKNIILNVYKK